MSAKNLIDIDFVFSAMSRTVKGASEGVAAPLAESISLGIKEMVERVSDLCQKYEMAYVELSNASDEDIIALRRNVALAGAEIIEMGYHGHISDEEFYYVVSLQGE